MSVFGLVHICISYFCPPEGPKRNDNPVTMSTPSSQILVSKYLYLVKVARTLGAVADSGAGEDKKQIRTEEHLIAWKVKNHLKKKKRKGE